MADNKKILINIEANARDFKRELIEANRVLKDFSSDFSSFATKVDVKLDAISNSFGALAKSVQSLSAPLTSMNTHLSQLVGAANATNSALATLDARIDGISNEIRSMNTATGTTTSSIKSMASATASASHSVSNMNASFKNRAVYDFEMSLKNVGREFRSMANLGGSIPFLQAATWNTAYSVVNAPVRAVQALTAGIKQQVDETAALEGELYDLEAYLGGPGGKLLSEFGAKMGGTGTEEQMKAAGLQALQNKILQIGQVSPFTAMEIAKATSSLAKAGVTIEEIAGSTGTALEAVNLLSQNTGESLDSSAEQLAKLQALNEASLAKTQKQFGQAVDSAAQFQIIVDGLAEADMSSAATASQLTQALFNVGGSAQNLNMSFFDTVSLVSAMVPAFESAASAGTSLKYVFSALSGGRSIKAKAAMQKLGLMDEYGQTVFFDEKGFKGLDFMTMQLRETFGDASGMAVDVRNRIITDIFGQDALKAISRLVSMTDEQAEEMLMMSAQLEENAKLGKQAAREVADIKNEGFEFDMELLRGSLDSIYKTLAMPLMKPLSNVTQTFTGIANAAFAVITSASDAEEQIKTAEKEFIQPSILPNAAKLFKSVLEYSKGLSVVLKQVTTQGWNFKTAATAMAAVLGTPFGQLESRAKQFEVSFKKLHVVIGDLIGDLPGLVNQFVNFVASALLSLMHAIEWFKENWDSVVLGLKVFIGIRFATQLWSIASAMYGVVGSITALNAAASATGTAGFFSRLAMLLNPEVAAAASSPLAAASGGGTPGGIAGAAASGTSPSRKPGARFAAARRLAARRAAAGVAGSAAGGIVSSIGSSAAGMVGMSAVSKMMASFTGFFSTANLHAMLGRMTVFGGKLIGIVKSPFTIIGLTITAFTLLFTNNINGLRDFVMERFGFIGTYLKQTFNIIYMAVMDAWNSLGGAFQAASRLHFVDGLSNVFKGVMQIIDGLVVTFGGALKLIVGLLTFNGDLIKNGLRDIFESVKIMLIGIVRGALGALQSLIVGAIELLNQIPGISISAFSVNSFFERIGNNAFFDAGSKVAEEYSRGLEYGLKDKTGQLKKVTMTAIKDSVIDPANEALLISSPSYVTYRMGMNVMTGLANGIADGSQLVTKEMLKVADSIANTNFHISGTGQTIFVQQLSPTVQGLGYEELYFQQTGRGIPALPPATVPDFIRPAFVSDSQASGSVPPNAPRYFGAQATAYTGVDSPQTMMALLRREKVADRTKPNDVLFNENPADYLIFSKGYQDFISNNPVVQDELAANGMSPSDYATAAGASKLIKTLETKYNLTLDEIVGIIANGAAQPGYTVKDYINSQDFISANALRTGRATTGITSIFEYDKFMPTMQELISQNADIVMYQKISTGRLKHSERYLKDLSNSAIPFTPNMRLAGQSPQNLTMNPYENPSMAAYTQSGAAVLSAQQYAQRVVDDVMTLNQNAARKFTDDYINTFQQQSTELFNQITSIELINRAKGVYGNGALHAAAVQDAANKPGVVPADAKPFTAPFGTYLGQGTYLKPYVRNDKPMAPPPQGGMYVGNGIYVPDGSLYDMGPPSIGYETVTTERVLSADEVNAMNLDQAYIPVVQLPQASTFEQLPNLHQFSSDGLDVAKIAKGFDISYGERGIKQRGLTSMFENNEQLGETYAQIGTRAATFLSMKRGKLTPEDQQLFRKYVAMDRADKKAYLDSVKIAQSELDAINKDSSLTDKQKKEKSAKVMSNLQTKSEPLTQGFTDVYGLKVGSLTDYQAGKSGVTAEAAKYTDVAMGTITTAITEAAASSAAFKKLPPEEQQKLLDSVKNMPLQAMAFLGDAMSDGFLDADEYALFETYVGEDVGTIRDVINRGTGPTFEEKNKAYMPYIEGSAVFASRENFSGDLAESMFMGWDNTVARMFKNSGQTAMREFISGAKGENGSGPVTLSDLLTLDPKVVQSAKEDGKESGTAIGGEIIGGIITGLTPDEAAKLGLEAVLGPKGDVIGYIRKLNEIKSPSELYEREVGANIMAGIIKGVRGGVVGLNQSIKSIMGEGIVAKIGDAEQTEAQKNAVAIGNAFYTLGAFLSGKVLEGFIGADKADKSFRSMLYDFLIKTYDDEGQDEKIIAVGDQVYAFGAKLGMETYTGYKDTLLDGKNSLGSAVDEWISASGDMSGKFKTLGESFASGIVAGLKAKGNDVAQAVADLVNGGHTEGEKTADVNSPSRLFRDGLGSSIGEGIAVGISDANGMVSSSVRKLVNSGAQYRPDVSNIALNGAASRMASMVNNTTNNYNLGVNTTQSPNAVQRSFAIMKAFKG